MLQVLERHITLDNTLKGTDHKYALNPGQLRALVDEVRRQELAMGSGEKQVLPNEMRCYEKVLNKNIYSYYI